MALAERKFSRRSRLLKPDDFRRVFDSGERSADQYFVVFALTNGLAYARLGLAISKKSTKRSVDRNRLKRLVRESFRTHQPLLAGFDLVVLRRQGILLSDNNLYQSSLSHLWRRVAKKCAVS